LNSAAQQTNKKGKKQVQQHELQAVLRYSIESNPCTSDDMRSRRIQKTLAAMLGYSSTEQQQPAQAK
jgi:hypothetical protein